MIPIKPNWKDVTVNVQPATGTFETEPETH